MDEQYFLPKHFIFKEPRPPDKEDRPGHLAATQEGLPWAILAVDLLFRILVEECHRAVCPEDHQAVCRVDRQEVYTVDHL